MSKQRSRQRARTGEAGRGQGRRTGQLQRANRLARQSQLLTMRLHRGRCAVPAASYSRDLDGDAGTDVCDVHPPGARPERSRAWREMAVDRPGDCQGSRSVGVPAAGAGELGQRVSMVEIPVGPGVDQRGSRQEVALVAFPAGQGPILNGTPVGGSIREQTLVALQNLAGVVGQPGTVRAGECSPGAIGLPGRSRCRTRRRGGPVPARIPRTWSRSGARPRPRRLRR